MKQTVLSEMFWFKSTVDCKYVTAYSVCISSSEQAVTDFTVFHRVSPCFTVLWASFSSVAVSPSLAYVSGVCPSSFFCKGLAPAHGERSEVRGERRVRGQAVALGRGSAWTVWCEWYSAGCIRTSECVLCPAVMTSHCACVWQLKHTAASVSRDA